MTLITTNSVSYLSSQKYQDAKRWEEKEPVRNYVIAAVIILGILAIVVAYSSLIFKQPIL